jgi:hypothetical protein
MGLFNDWRPNSLRHAIVDRQTRAIEVTGMTDPRSSEGGAQSCREGFPLLGAGYAPCRNRGVRESQWKSIQDARV